jgi:hypothetical protein
MLITVESLMSVKAHGTSEFPVQKNLRWQCDENTADRICNYNRHWAEFAGYFASSKVTFMKEMQEKATAGATGPTIFYDSVTGKPLFKAPVGKSATHRELLTYRLIHFVGRTYDAFISESLTHGWPSFRDNEVVWENVRVLKGGETVSLSGTHLGHNLPDR